MAAGTWPDVASGLAGITRVDGKTAGTFDISIDPKLWAALQAKSPILDMLARPSVDEVEFKWETDVAPTRIYTSIATNNTVISSGADTGNVLSLGASAYLTLEPGTILRNITRATPVPYDSATYGQNELLEVTTVPASGECTVVRDAAGQADATHTSNVHASGDQYEVVYRSPGEGSGPGANKYTDVQLVSNNVAALDFFLMVTGDQLASKRLVAGDTVANQTQKMLTKMQNDLEGMFFYGKGKVDGTASAVRATKGFDSFVGAQYGNYDITTKDVTPAALDGLMAEILYDKSDPGDRYIIACHPHNARKISTFGMDKVRLGQQETKYGRYIDTFKTDLGIDLPVIWSLNISRSDLFIIDMDKVSLPVFRPFAKAEWSYGDDGVDAWRQRYLGAFGVKVVDGLYSHAKLAMLPWT